MSTITLKALKALGGRGDPISNREPFNAATLYGVKGYYGTVGALSDWETPLQADAPEYVVYSYSTPIAWYGKRGWVIPPVKYGQTTSHHQAIVRAIVLLPGDYLNNQGVVCSLTYEYTIVANGQVIHTLDTQEQAERLLAHYQATNPGATFTIESSST